MGPPYSVTFVDRGFSRYLAGLFSQRDLDFSSYSFLHSVINRRPPSVTVSVELWASRSVCFQFCWIERLDVAFHACYPHSFSCPPRSFLTPSFIVPNITRLGIRPSPMRVRAPADSNFFARKVAPILSHPVSSSARLYERTRRSDLRRLAPIMRNRTLWWTVRSFL